MKPGRILAAAAVIVGLPRHLVAQLHAAGFAAPNTESWTVLVVGSALAWAVLEAATMFSVLTAYQHTKQKRLAVFAGAILATIALTNAPSLVADSARMGLTDLLGIASPAHWIWSVSSIATTLLVVVAAGAADAAIEEKKITERIDDIDRRYAETAFPKAPQAAITSTAAINTRLETSQPAISAAPILTAQDNKETGKDRSGNTRPKTNRIDAAKIQELLKSNPAFSDSELAKKLGVTRQAIYAWRKRNP